MEVTNIETARIVPPKERIRHGISEVEIDELAQSIQQVGLLQPIIVTPLGEKYAIVAGERRYLAMKRLEKEFIPCIILEGSQRQNEIVQLVENIQRVDTTPLEEADVVIKLKRQYNLTSKRIAELLGKSDGWVSQRMAVEEWEDELYEAVRNGYITFSVAREIHAEKDPKIRETLLREAIEFGLSADDVILRRRVLFSLEEKTSVDKIFEEKDNENDIVEKYHDNLNKITCTVCGHPPGIQNISHIPVCQVCYKRIVTMPSGELG